jgi:hypothetical protein
MRDVVLSLKSGRHSDQRIARHLGISRNTLLKHFASELAAGRERRRPGVSAGEKSRRRAGSERRPVDSGR